ncbi:hypothetical protein ABID21_003822 [Pseudorhizobium tarimense]|uniref:Uncharacterized protein n=1 Tax=Pseudorhizobium tarimense TaxID=1079109 RepID=A0ABV2HB61_9HYPH
MLCRRATRLTEDGHLDRSLNNDPRSRFFFGAAAVIFFAGLRITGLADRLADRIGFGEALI